MKVEIFFRAGIVDGTGYAIGLEVEDACGAGRWRNAIDCVDSADLMEGLIASLDLDLVRDTRSKVRTTFGFEYMYAGTNANEIRGALASRIFPGVAISPWHRLHEAGADSSY
jgi:hypothetical protein